MLAVIAAGGEVPEAGDAFRRRLFGSADLVVAADSGLVCCVQHEVWPDVLIGDLDSAPSALVDQARARGVEVARYPVDKDATDLELAIELAVYRGADKLEVIAPFGARIDHQLANVALLASDRWSASMVSGHDGVRSLWVVRRSLTLSEPVGNILTLLPWGGDTIGVTTTGLRWQLSGDELSHGETRGVSNVCDASSQSIEIEGGILLIIADRTLGTRAGTATG